MSKDPAFLFYSADAAEDVSHMNRVERGCYFDLIQFQRKFRGFTVEQARKVLGSDFETCWPSIELILKVDGAEFYIPWMRESQDKREVFKESQRNRIQKYWDSKKDTTEIPRNNDGNTGVLPLVNENVNEIENSKLKIVNAIIADLNEVCGTAYKPTSEKTRKLIKARLNDGFVFEDFKHVHRVKYREWGNDAKQVVYLRPETLYGNKFEGYKNQKELETTSQTNGTKNNGQLRPNSINPTGDDMGEF